MMTGGSGAFWDMALVNAESIARKPERLNHTEAAALTYGVSSWQVLTKDIELEKGKRF